MVGLLKSIQRPIWGMPRDIIRVTPDDPKEPAASYSRFHGSGFFGRPEGCSRHSLFSYRKTSKITRGTANDRRIRHSKYLALLRTRYGGALSSQAIPRQLVGQGTVPPHCNAIALVASAPNRPELLSGVPTAACKPGCTETSCLLRFLSPCFADPQQIRLAARAVL